jgi:Fe-S cluster assembly iron-binding protein IscA
MLTVTEAAARAINSLITKNEMPDGAGLRISPQSKTTRAEGLGLSIARAPADDDTVLDAHGARVFLAQTVVFDLHEQQLDVDEVGEQVRFFVERRPKDS